VTGKKFEGYKVSRREGLINLKTFKPANLQTDPMDPEFGFDMIGKMISYYKIIEKIGEGGMPVPLKRSESGGCGL